MLHHRLRSASGSTGGGPDIPRDGLILEYTFDDRSGTTIFDGSDSGLDATATASVSYPTGAVGDSALFDNTTDSITVADNAILRPAIFSFSFWIKFTTTGNTVVFEKGSNNTEWSVQTSSSNTSQVGSISGRIMLLARGGLSLLYGSTVINDDSWHHVVLINNGSDDKCYIDGSDVTGSRTESNPLYTTAPIILGQRSGGIARFPGHLDQWRMYNRALSPVEVISLYEEGL